MSLGVLFLGKILAGSRLLYLFFGKHSLSDLSLNNAIKFWLLYKALLSPAQYSFLNFEQITAAKNADIIILFLGMDTSVENEMHDRTNLSLPGVQLQLAQEIKANIRLSFVLLIYF
jgi:hypothetical protein